MNRKVLRNKAYLMAHSFNRTKLFHSKKGWLMSSALVLAMLGVGASANQARVHAANAQPTTQNQVTPAKAKPASSVAGSASAKVAQPNSVASTGNNKSASNTPVNSGSVVSQAKDLHNKIASNSNNYNTYTVPTNNRAWDFVHGIKDNQSNSNQPTNNQKEPAKPAVHFGEFGAIRNVGDSSNIQTGHTIDNEDLNYKFNKSTGNFEVTDGNNVFSDDMHGEPGLSPSGIKNINPSLIKSITVDSGEVQSPDGSISNFPSLKYIDVSKLNVNHVVNDNGSKYHLKLNTPYKEITLGNNMVLDKGNLDIIHMSSDASKRNELIRELGQNAIDPPTGNTITNAKLIQEFTEVDPNELIQHLKNDSDMIVSNGTTNNAGILNNINTGLQQGYLKLSSDIKPFFSSNNIRPYQPTFYRKDANDKYSAPTSTNLLDGQSHPGTWLTYRNPAPTSDVAYIQYQNNGKNVGNPVATSKHKFNTTATIGSLTDLSAPKGYQPANSSQQVKFNSNTYDVSIEPLPNLSDAVIFEAQSDNRQGRHTVIGESSYYGQKGSSVTLQNSDIPQGYELADPNNNNFTIGSFDNDTNSAHDAHIFMVKPSKPSTSIPAIPNTVNIKGRVILHYSDGTKSRNIPLDYLIQDSGDEQVNLLNYLDYGKSSGTQPSDFADGQIIQGFNTSNFQYNGNQGTGKSGKWLYTPTKSDTDFNHGSTNLINPNDLVLDYTATNGQLVNGKTDNIEYITSDGNVVSQEEPEDHDGKSLPVKSDTLHIPAGYQLSNNNPSTLYYDGLTHNIHVVGKQVKSFQGKQPIAKIQVTENPNDSKSSSTIPLSDYRIGDTFTINPSQYAPKGYNTNTSDEPVTVHIEPTNNGNGYTLSFSNSTIQNQNGTYTVPYAYTYNSGNNAANPLTFQYKDGNNIVSTKTYDVPAGTQEDPTTSLPSGYNFKTGVNTSKVAAGTSDVTRTFSVTRMTANQLPSDTGQGNVNVHIVEKDKNGNVIDSTNKVVNEGMVNVGSDFTIKPSDVKPSGVYNSSDKSIQGVITNNGVVTTNGTDTFTYVVMPNPTTVNFKDANTNKNLSSSTVNDSPDTTITDADVPEGYHLPSDTSYSFNKAGKLINNKTGNTISSIPVEGDPVQGKAHIVLRYNIENQEGNQVVKTITDTPDDAQIILNGEVGGSQTINPWKYWKKNFTLPSDTQKTDTINFKPSDSVLSNDENGQQFNPTLVYNAYAQQAGDVVVKYVDVDSGQPIGSDKDIKISDLGNPLVGQRVELGQSGANKDVANNNNSDVHYVLNVPSGYHLEHNANPIIMQAAQTKLSAVGAMPRLLFSLGQEFHRPVGVCLTVGLSNPNAKPASTKSGSASSASTKASGSTSASNNSANGTSTSGNSVAPSSTNSSANSSADNNSGSTTASSATNNNNSATQSGNSSAENGTNSSANSASGNSANPSSSANAASSANTDNIMPFIPAVQNSSSASSSAQSANVTPASASISSVAPSFVISPNSSATQSSATNNSATPSSSDTTVEPAPASQASQSDQSDTTKASSDVPVLSNHKNDNTNASDAGNALVPTVHANANTNDAGISGNALSPAVSGNGASENAIVPSDNVSVPSDDVASSNNVANPNASAEKLPQTNEASNYTGIMTVVALMLGVGLVGVDVERKHE